MSVQLNEWRTLVCTVLAPLQSSSPELVGCRVLELPGALAVALAVTTKAEQATSMLASTAAFIPSLLMALGASLRWIRSATANLLPPMLQMQVGTQPLNRLSASPDDQPSGDRSSSAENRREAVLESSA